MIARDGTQGYADVTGELVISGPYEQVFGFRNGLGAVIMYTDENSPVDSRVFSTVTGFVDFNGNMVIEPVYPMTGSFNEGLCPVMTTEELWGAIDTEGHWVIEPVFMDMGPFINGYAPVVMSQEVMAQAAETPEDLQELGAEVLTTKANQATASALEYIPWLVLGSILVMVLTTVKVLKNRAKEKKA